MRSRSAGGQGDGEDLLAGLGGERADAGHAGARRGQRADPVAAAGLGPGQAADPRRRPRGAAGTSVLRTSWAAARIGGLPGPQTGGSHRISALAPSGTGVTGIGSLATQASQEVFTVTLPAR